MVGAELSRVLQSTSKTVGCILSLKSSGFSGVPDVDIVTVGTRSHTHSCRKTALLLDFWSSHCQTVNKLSAYDFALEEGKFVPALSLSYTSALLFIWMIIVFGGGLCCDYCCVQHFRFLSVFTGG